MTIIIIIIIITTTITPPFNITNLLKLTQQTSSWNAFVMMPQRPTSHLHHGVCLRQLPSKGIANWKIPHGLGQNLVYYW
jgi:hypothetical protein